MNREELKEKYGKKPEPRQWQKTDFISTQICTFFCSGMSPKAPGTMGSLAATIVAYPMALLFKKFPMSIMEYSINFFLASLFVFFAAIPFVNKAMNDTKTEDPGWIVIDEVCGIFMAFAFIDPMDIITRPWLLAIGFAIFRFFDILKPLGIHRFEKFPRAWGVMADDLLGGIYSGIFVLAIVKIISLV